MATNLAERRLQIPARRSADECLFADAFEHAPNGMALLDSGGDITQVNIAFCKTLGFSRNELLGSSWSEITHVDDVETDAEQRRRLASGEIDRYQLVQRIIRKDGLATWILLSVSVRRGTRELPEYYVLQVANAGGHLSVENGASLGGLLDRLGEALHEIGNTLTPLMVNTELIVEQSQSGEISDSAHVIFNAARRIAFTLRRLRGIKDLRPVAYLGPNRMLDLRLVAPPRQVD